MHGMAEFCLRRHGLLAAVAIVLIYLALMPMSTTAAPFDGFEVVDTTELERMRGGFTAQLGGVRVDFTFGIERATFINGRPVVMTLARTPESGVSLVQNGVGNRFASLRLSPTPVPAAALNVIQNSLDNQTIRQMTIIDAKVRNLEAFAAGRFSSALGQQILRSVR